MIPKTIHYCWFGGSPMPELSQKCIESWKKYCPDYEIKCWDETSIDLSSVDYMREAYEEKAWGFVSDVARLQILYDNGGIYLDTDVEMIKSFDELLCNAAFAGLEDDKYVALGLGVGAEKGNPVVKAMLDDYLDRHFKLPDGTFDRTPCPKIQTDLLTKLGFNSNSGIQCINGMTIYPSEYFCPKSFKTGKVNITDNTYSIHHYDGSWLTDEIKYLVTTRHKLTKFMPNKIAELISDFVTLCRYHGVVAAVKQTTKWVKKATDKSDNT